MPGCFVGSEALQVQARQCWDAGLTKPQALTAMGFPVTTVAQAWPAIEGVYGSRWCQCHGKGNQARLRHEAGGPRMTTAEEFEPAETHAVAEEIKADRMAAVTRRRLAVEAER